MIPVTRESYQESLSELRTDVTAMGDLVADRLDAALSARSDGDDAVAREVVAGDDEINRRYLDLEDRCIELFALQQPVAGDLRFVAASFKVLTDFERVGDLASNLGGYALAADGDRRPGVAVEDIGRDALAMFDRSVTAYANTDAAACRDIAADDDDLDALCQRASESVARELVEREAGGDDAWAVERLLDDVSRLLLTIRDLERVGDHAVNVAGRTLYMAESDPALIY